MPRLIFKCPYLKGGERNAAHLSNYVRYMATREGAQSIDPGRAEWPATKKQQQMVARLIRDFPLSRGMFEYEDYQAHPTRANASEFITRALEDNYDQVAKRENYMDYIAQRPRAERVSSHALFTGEDAPLVLSQIADEVAHHPGNVWLPIFSLRREDATRLGYDTAQRWQTLLSAHAPEIAKAMKIPWEDFRWYAAFHDEGHHPHVHMVCYSADGTSGFLTKEGIAAIKSVIVKDIFQQELTELYQNQTKRRDELTAQARETMGQLIAQMEMGTLDNPHIEELTSYLSQQLQKVKGDLARNYGTIAKKYYGYRVSVIDLRNPTRSDGNNLLTLVNRYMDIARKDPKNIAARAKAEKYAKILSKTIINPDGDAGNRGQNAFFYDAAEGVLCAAILLLAEFLPPADEDSVECRHIVSVFKLVQDLLEPSGVKGKSKFQLLMNHLPSDHKARWFAGAALNSAEQAMASVMSTVLSRLNAFLDSELEQVLCFDSAIDAETFAAEKSAIFLILPEEDSTKNFMAGLMIQQLSRELFAVADENGGRLKNRVVLFCDELGTMPPFEILPLFSAGRSRRLTLVPIIQSLAQLEKNYGKEGCEIIQDNCQDTIFGGFAPNSQTAEVLSKALGNRTVLSGSVTRGKDSNSQSLQMAERPLMSPDELRSIPKEQFIVMKTGSHPMKTRLRLFLDWGITFEDAYVVPERADRRVRYAGCEELEQSITQQRNAVPVEEPQREQAQIEQQEAPLPAESKALMVAENQQNRRATFVHRGDEP